MARDAAEQNAFEHMHADVDRAEAGKLALGVEAWVSLGAVAHPGEQDGVRLRPSPVEAPRALEGGP